MTRTTKVLFFAGAAALTALAGAAIAQAPAPAPMRVALVGAGGKDMGFALITEAPKGVVVRIEAQGLTPGWHGMHFHETGACAADAFTSAGAHVHDMTPVVHGLLNAQANDKGDLPNIFAGADGKATAEVYSDLVSLKGAGGRPALIDADGSALVVHASPDDLSTQPIGGAGARVACGVIK